MCTVSFLPLEDGFILTSNRDELKARKADFPQTYESKSGVLTFPQDPKAGGTWIAGCSTKMICLLNGAFKKHKHNPPYRHSRGKVVLDAFDATSFSDFRENYNFDNLEPHTLVMIEFGTELEVIELRWDGETKHISNKSSQDPHIWSSATLYPSDIIAQREEWFKKWLANHSFTLNEIKKFHTTGGSGNVKNDLLMKRTDDLKTISITSFEHTSKQTRMIYEDLIDQSLKEIKF